MLRSVASVSFGLILALSAVGCSDDAEPGTTPPADTGTGTTDTGGGGSDTGGGTDTGSADDTGTADDTGSTGDTASSDADDGGPGDTGGDTGDASSALKVVQGCAEGDYVDETASGSPTISNWISGKNCIKIKAGQTVTWTGGNFTAHPLIASGGDTPSPITKTTSGTSKTFTFPSAGVYGYVCELHPTMKGAVWVLP